MKLSVLLTITSIYTLISITNGQTLPDCTADCSGCDSRPFSCPEDTTHRCIYDFPQEKCIVDQCGPDCSLCDTNLTCCDADPICFYLTDNNVCKLSDTCASDCTLCTQAECQSVGAGGNSICEWKDECIGTTCDTNCGRCFVFSCADSRAPPNGCKLHPVNPEICLEQTGNPTVDPTTSPSYPPTLRPTQEPTKSPTKSPTNNPSLSPTNNPSLAPSEFPSIPPTRYPSIPPTQSPTLFPTTTVVPSINPTFDPTFDPTMSTTPILSTLTKNAVVAGVQAEINNLFIIVGISLTFVLALFIVICIMCLVMVKLKNNIDKRVVVQEKQQIPPGNENDVSNINDDVRHEGHVLVDDEGINYEPIAIPNGSDQSDSDDIEELFVPMIQNDETKMEIENIKNNLSQAKKTTNVKNISLKAWFEQKINIPNAKNIYYQLFVENGYESVEIIQLLTENKLQKMGIKKAGHIDKIMMEINKLKCRPGNVDATNNTDKHSELQTLIK